MYPLIAVTLPPVDDPKARDTIVLLAGVHTADMPDVLRLAAEGYVRRALNLPAETDTPRTTWHAIWQRLGWHVVESGVACGGLMVSVAAFAVAQALADLDVAVEVDAGAAKGRAA